MERGKENLVPVSPRILINHSVEMYLSEVTSQYLSKVSSMYLSEVTTAFLLLKLICRQFCQQITFFSRRPSGLSVPPPSCQQMIINLRKIGNFRKILPHVVKISIPPRDIAAKVNADRFDNGIFPRRKKC